MFLFVPPVFDLCTHDGLAWPAISESQRAVGKTSPLFVLSWSTLFWLGVGTAVPADGVGKADFRVGVEWPGTKGAA